LSHAKERDGSARRRWEVEKAEKREPSSSRDGSEPGMMLFMNLDGTGEPDPGPIFSTAVSRPGGRQGHSGLCVCESVSWPPWSLALSWSLDHPVKSNQLPTQIPSPVM